VERLSGARAQPVWIGDAQPVFGLYHPPAVGLERATAVLFCAPFGWEDMGSYPVRAVWAQRLAAAGHPVLRFDLPGTGQSTGAPGDPGQVRGWLRSIAQTASWLRDAGTSARVATIGIGLGGLLALAATAEGAAIDDLVLWGTPPSGRALTRRLRAFAGLQESAQDGEDRALPSGWLQSAGYVLDAETIADLNALGADPLRVGRLRRALLLDQDATPADAALTERLAKAGVEAETAPGPGYTAMLDNPDLSLVPDMTIATVAAWLKRAPTPTSAPDEAVPVTREQLVLDGTGVRECAFYLERTSGRTMFGVLAEPSKPADEDICLICLPAWAERCIGPSRLWVEVARRHAARGITVLRVDLESIGDSDGPREEMRIESAVWEHDRIVQVREVMDALQQQGHGSRFLLLGQCAGGYWAQQAAADPRVVGIVGLNPMVSREGKALLQNDAARRALLVIQPGWWRRLTRGEVNIRKGITTVSKGFKSQLQRLLSGAGSEAGGGMVESQTDDAHSITTLLDLLRQRNARMILGFAQREVGYNQLELEGVTEQLERWPALRIYLFQSTDHNLRALSHQQAIHALVDDLVAGVRPACTEPS
jgi:alpha-beta hydrolase superfamily lysophospholipase